MDSTLANHDGANTFATLQGLPPQQLNNLTELGYTTMTPVQQAALPALLDGDDVIAEAQTGSGKTAAFGIGLLTRINPRFFGTQALILAPTRELATQIAKELRRLARYLPNIKILTLCGGQPLGPQIGSLEHGAHIVVGTPGRLVDHLNRGTLQLDQIHTLVLDEADRMLEMGFNEAIETLLGATPASRQTLLFSATYPKNILDLSSRYQRNPKQITVEVDDPSPDIEQHCVFCEQEDKPEQVLRLLAWQKPESAVLFCNTRERCNEFSAQLAQAGYDLVTLHGDMDQRERDLQLARFANHSATLLIATDVAARGLDVDNIELVINVDLPREPAVYTHRIGRTGRAGAKGAAYSLVGPKETRKLERVEDQQKRPIPPLELPLAAVPANFRPRRAQMVTLEIAGGRKHKLRPGDIVGTLTAAKKLNGQQIGQIQVGDFQSFVAVERDLANTALEQLRQRPIKGRNFRARKA